MTRAPASFAVLGPLEVTVGAAPVKVPGRRERAVLCVLLASCGGVVSAERLVDEIWGESATASATSSLQVAVSRLRALLEPDRSPREEATLLVSVGLGYALRVSGDAVDAVRVQRLVETARDLVGTYPAKAAELCEEATRLWRGTPYDDAGDGDLVRAERTRLEELRHYLREVHIEALLGAGRHALVVGELEALVATHPFRERLWELYALALYRCGRQAHALAALDAARTTLADEVGVDPTPALQQLQQAILNHEVAAPRTSPVDGTPPAPATPFAAPAVAPTRPPLVGRDAEFDRLRAAMAEASAGQTVFGLVEGEPGIGKTRLLEELAAFARTSGARVVWGRCSQVDVAPAFWPWREVIRALAADGLADRLPDDVAALTDPERLIDAHPTQERRFRLFDEFARALANAAAERPLLVLFEDLHWSDAASADLLHHLVDTAYDAPVAVVASLRELELGRDDAVTDAIGAMSRRPGTRRTTLGGVAAAASPALVTVFAEHEVSPDVATAIHRRADGNPFCMAELTRLLASSQLLDRANAVDEVNVPAGVRDVVRRRLSVLPEPSRRLLEVAAVVGREFDLQVLVAASGFGLDECLERLEPLLVSRVVAPIAEVPGRHRFAHALVTEAALADLTSLRAARLHAAVADALVATSGDAELELVAAHLWSAVAVVGAVPAAVALERAAEVSVRRTGYEAAQDLLERALALRQTASVGMHAAADEAELVTTLRLAGLRRARFGYSHAFEAIPLDRPKELAQRTGRTDLFMGLLYLHWAALATSSQVEAATELAWQMHEIGQSSGDAVVRLLADHCWGVQCWHLGRLHDGAVLMMLVRQQLAALSPDDEARLGMFDSPAFFTAFALHILELAGEADDADEQFEEHFYRSYTLPYDVLVLVNFAAFSGVHAGDAERALRWARRGMAADNGCDFEMFGATAQVFGGWAMATVGDPQQGLALLETGLSRFRATGARTAYGAVVGLHVEAMLAAGRPLPQVSGVLDAGAAEAVSLGEPLTLPYLDLARARCAAHGGDADEAVVRLDAAERAAGEQGNALLVRRVAKARQAIASPFSP